MIVNQAVVRLLLRYLAGAMVTFGIVSADNATFADDPLYIEAASAVIGTLIGVATEWHYSRAKRTGDADKL